MSNIDSSEWEDLDHTLAKYKRTREEFDFAEIVSRPINTGIDPLLGTLTITLSDTGEAKTYKTGHGSA